MTTIEVTNGLFAATALFAILYPACLFFARQYDLNKSSSMKNVAVILAALFVFAYVGTVSAMLATQAVASGVIFAAVVLGGSALATVIYVAVRNLLDRNPNRIARAVPANFA